MKTFDVNTQQTALFDKYGVFFAFGQDQFNKGCEKVGAGPDTPLVAYGNGMYGLKSTNKQFVKELSELDKTKIQWELDNNSKQDIIKYHLWNYECYYSWDITDAVESCKEYGFTADDVQAVFDTEKHKHTDI